MVFLTKGQQYITGN